MLGSLYILDVRQYDGLPSSFVRNAVIPYSIPARGAIANEYCLAPAANGKPHGGSIIDLQVEASESMVVEATRTFLLISVNTRIAELLSGRCFALTSWYTLFMNP